MSTIGVEWVNRYHGQARDLKNCDENAQGFYQTLDGILEFEYGDDDAWDEDFEEYGLGNPPSGTDQSVVENVNICYFSGHGAKKGSSFGVTKHDDGTAKPSECRLGGELKWLVFDACRVLKDDEEVVNRWKDVFAGLHAILGFATLCNDIGERGKKFAEKLNDGYTVRVAWIRACEETAENGTRWAILRADDKDSNTFDDHWYGKGYVSRDPVNAPEIVYESGTCW